MDTKLLRQKILDLAIHGKLVPQDPNDEPAVVLLERIKEEKERLIKEGKIKDSKKSKSSDTSHYEKIEGPFEIPESWEWCVLPQISEHFLGKTLNRSTDYGEDTQYLCSINIYWDGITLDNIKTAKFTKEERTKYRIQKGDILVCEGGDVGRSAIWEKDSPMYFQNALHRIRLFRNISSQYVLFCIRYYKNIGLIDHLCKGVTIKHFTQNIIDSICFPLPPLVEQQRIVAAVERWTTLIDTIESGTKNLQLSVSSAKSKILDLAIHGKLVTQDPSDEPAIELLKRINPDFKPCDNSHYPFEIPSSWVFVSGKDIFLPMKSTKPSGDEFSYIDIDSVDNKNNVIPSPKRVKTENAPSRASRFTKKGDVVFSMVRPYLRNIAAVRENGCIASTGFFVCSPNKSIHSDYMFLMMLSSYVIDGLNQFMKGDNSPSINTDNILSWKYPVPPLNEQRRIVAEVQRLYQCLEQIETHLTT